MVFKNRADMSSRNVYDFSYEPKDVVLAACYVPSSLQPKPMLLSAE